MTSDIQDRYTGSQGYTGSKGDIGYTGSAGAVSADTQIIFNSSGALVGNASLTFAYSSNTMNVNGAINATSHSVGSNFIANTTQVTLASTVKLSANGTVGSNGKYLSSNGSTPSWIQIPAFNQVSNSAPTTPTPISGDRWYDSDSGIQYTYLTGVSGSQWVETSTTGAASTVYNKSTFTATASQTTFSVTYTVGYIDVFVNGVKLTTGDYTATNGTSVVLGVACAVNDIVEIIGWSVWTITNTNVGIGSGTSLALGGATIGTNALAVTGTANISGATTLSGALTYGGVTLSNSVTGTGSMVLSASPTFTGTVTAAGVIVAASQSTLLNYTDWAAAAATMTIGGSSVGITYHRNSWYWMRIGNLVIVTADIAYSSLGGLSGNVQWTLSSGMPLTQNTTYAPTAGSQSSNPAWQFTLDRSARTGVLNKATGTPITAADFPVSLQFGFSYWCA